MQYREEYLALKAQNNQLLELHNQTQSLLRQKDEYIKQSAEQIALLELQVESLSNQLKQLQRMVFGSRSERFETPGQLSLLDVTPNGSPNQEVEQFSTRKKKSNASADKLQPKRGPLPESLPREIIEIMPEQDVTGLVQVGYEITEVLEMTPSRMFVKQYRRPKFVLPATDGLGAKFIVAQAPSLPIPRSFAGPSVIAEILVNKFVDHLPLDRQLKRFKRAGIEMNDSTMNDWVREGIKVITVLHDRITELQRQSGYKQLDETTIRVLDSSKPKATHRGYFWVSHSPPDKLTLYQYHKGRGEEYPKEFLEGFNGFLQTDGLAVYERVCANTTITHLVCMAHARRKFDEALSNDRLRASFMLERIQQLYLVEEHIRQLKLTDEQIVAKRQQESMPVLLDLKQWLTDNIVQVTPTSSIGRAIAYSLARWDKLMIYCTDARLQIDNNPVENKIRPSALGRKNYMFAGNHEAAQRNAIMYTLFANCANHDVNPLHWLTDILTRIQDHPMADIDQLLPHNWKILQSKPDEQN